MSLIIMLLSFFGLSLPGIINKEGLDAPRIDVCSTGSCEHVQR